MTEREAIANIERARKWLGRESDFSDEALDMAISALEKQKRDRWIPVTERPPELDEEVLVTDQYGDVWQATYIDWCGDERFVTAEESMTLEGVIAWRPLPEPYKAEGES